MSSWSRPASDRATACQTTATAITAAATAHQYVTNTVADPHHDARGQGERLPEVRQDHREARQHEGQQEDDRGRAHDA